VSYRISAGRCIQLLADTQEMVTDTLWVVRVAIEGPYNDFDDILTSALYLWRDDAKFRYLYSNP
jgi:hypothetical protein